MMFLSQSTHFLLYDSNRLSFPIFDSPVKKLLMTVKWFSHVKHLKMNTDHLSQGL